MWKETSSAISNQISKKFLPVIAQVYSIRIQHRYNFEYYVFSKDFSYWMIAN